MNTDKLKEVLRLHEKWVKDEDGGERADLQWADLRGADLRGAYLRGAYLRGAYLRGAYLRGAYLRGADLRGAYLRGADLRGADLQGADLRGAYLRGAYLRGADLQGAKGFNPYRCTPLLMLLDQPGEIVAYKLIKANGEGPFNGGINYLKGPTFRVPKSEVDSDPNNDCGPGINVATLDWCIREWKPGYRILKMSFTAKDIACIPHCTDGKFRLYRCKRVGEVDLKAIGIIEDKILTEDAETEDKGNG